MGALEQTVAKMIKAHARQLQVKEILSGVAKSVGQATCDVARDNAPDLLDVRLNAIDDDLQSFVTLYPAEGSQILVGIIEGMKTEAVVLRCSEIEKVAGKMGAVEFTIDKNGYRITVGSDSLQSVLNDFITEVTKIVVIQGVGPNVPALTAIAQRLGQILK